MIKTNKFDKDFGTQIFKCEFCEQLGTSKEFFEMHEKEHIKVQNII